MSAEARLRARIEELEEELRALRTILDHAHECTVVVDRDGYITYMNKPYEDLLGIPPGSAVGKHVTQVIENTRMHIVARTGVAEVGWTQRIKGEERIVQRIPIYRNGEVVGAIGKFMFKDLAELKALTQRIGLLESKVELYERELKSIRGSRYTFDQIIGTSRALTEAKALAMRAAQSQANILLLGESGTGKELFAHAIHQHSSRAHGPFVRINCAAIPPDLLEAELFGFEEGSFTGARRGGKPGKLELAHRGTLFLDEIGDMPLSMQAKILRAVQEKEYERVGGVQTRQVDVRIVAATHTDLERLVAEGRFRGDLYYRLNVISVRLPPLRERPEDVPLLVTHYLRRLADEQGTPPRYLDPAVMALFQRYSWPGNVRELINLLERLVYTVDAPIITEADLPPAVAHRLAGGAAPLGAFRSSPTEACGVTASLQSPAATDPNAGMGTLASPVVAPESPPVTQATASVRSAGPPLKDAVAAAADATERGELLRALGLAGGRKAQAARILGIHRSTLYEKLRKHGIRG